MERSMKGSVMGPFTGAKIYSKCKLILKGYEKQHNVRPIKDYTKKMMKTGSEGQKTEIKNGIEKVLTQNSENVVEEYYEGQERVMTCNYSVKQGAMNKSTMFKCTFDSDYAKEHAIYYFLKLSLMHNMVTDKTESYLNQLMPKQSSQLLSQHK